MNFLEDRLSKEAIIQPDNILITDSFLGQQMDIVLLEQIGEELCRRYQGCHITKILTLETSGIPIAYPVAKKLGVPLVIARRSHSAKLDADVYKSELDPRYYKSKDTVIVAKKLLSSDDHVLIVDDLLANGGAIQCLISLAEAADATVVGVAVAWEKGFLEGGHRIRNLGYRLESIAIVDAINPAGGITFRHS